MTFPRKNLINEVVSKNESWKAQAFLNFYLPTKSGGKKKVGMIPLKESRPNDAALIQMLSEDQSKLQEFLSKLEITFHMADDDDSFDL